MRTSHRRWIDVRTNELVDADPETGGVQAIELAGRRPAYKMTLESQNRRLYVSVPAGFFDPFDGAVEEIDLDTLQSLGFITTEGLLQTLDLSAFTLVSPEKGFVVTHTEIVESSHVTGFSRQTGTPVSQIYTTLFGFDPEHRSTIHRPHRCSCPIIRRMAPSASWSSTPKRIRSSAPTPDRRRRPAGRSGRRSSGVPGRGGSICKWSRSTTRRGVCP